ncbi:MAG: acetate--CoA ligase family protein [Deltaproteobacteria bacterium]|nr:acetate--CoA ligase family protein [Deltaproteobacteria bacterium]
MRIYEFEGKQVFARAGLAVPREVAVIRSPDEADALEVSGPVMVKAQVLVGGRGKAGGVVRARSGEEARAAVRRILGMDLKGYPVQAVLVEEALEFTGACYLGIIDNPATGNLVVMASASGGVDIEEVALSRPEAILRVELEDNPDRLPPEIAERIGAFLARDLGEGAALAAALADMAAGLYALYEAHDCRILEINPLLVTPSGPVAADAKMVLDDNALFRQGDLLAFLGIASRRHDVSEPTARERRAAQAGFAYLDLLPEDARREPGRIYVGLVPGGAGYGIFSIDEVRNVGDRVLGGRVTPLNFMDSGGGPTRKAVAEMFALLMDHPLCDLVITSRFGGISSCDTFIRGLVDCLRDRRAKGMRVVPVHGRMVGTDLPSARAFLEKARQETPEPLADLTMVVGNQKIMAEVIRDGLEAWVARQEVHA